MLLNFQCLEIYQGPPNEHFYLLVRKGKKLLHSSTIGSTCLNNEKMAARKLSQANGLSELR